MIYLSSEFWVNFWPNLASTICGLIIGLPLGLWTNRLVISSETRKQRKNDKNRLDNALQIIKETLVENLTRLENTRSVIQGNQVQFDTEIDTSAWDAIKSDIVQFLKVPLLQKRIAYHFSRIASYARLNQLYLDSTSGISSALLSSPVRRTNLKTYILENIEFLVSDSHQINQLIDAHNLN
jgi:hypothetical protein